MLAADNPIEVLHTLTSELLQHIEEALAADDREAFRRLIEQLTVEEKADALEAVPNEYHQKFLLWMGKQFNGEFLSCLDETVRANIFDLITNKEFAKAISELDSDDALDLIEELSDQDQQEILGHLPATDKALLEESLAYPEDSAGRLMQHEIVAIPDHWDVGHTIDYMRNEDNELPDEFYEIFIVDPRHKVLGKIPVSKVLRTPRKMKVADIMMSEFKRIPVETDQEDVALIFRQYGLVDAPVVDNDDRLLGVITVDDIVHVIEEEAKEDLLRLSGAGESDIYQRVFQTFRTRSTWLLLNLITAIVASAVIAQFSSVIEKVVALAVLMPVVASMAGNAGTQTLAVAVRAIAMRELTSTNAARVLGKEILVGLLNGLLFALLTGILVYFWFDDVLISSLLALSTIGSLIIANLSGAAIPLVLSRLNIDPAVASSVFLTTVTDVVAFFSFLGLASLTLM